MKRTNAIFWIITILISTIFIVWQFWGITSFEEGLVLSEVNVVKPLASIAPTPTPTSTPTPTAKPVARPVLFTSQAPLGQWSDPIYQDGCEEASVIMAMQWAQNFALDEKLEVITPGVGTAKIKELSDYQKENYACHAASEGELCVGEYRDRSATDVAQLIRDYYKHDGVNIVENVSTENIKDILSQGKIAILPMNGRLLRNKYYTPPGPERHMLVVKDYDASTDEFITNDPGTKFGHNLRYDAQVLHGAIRDYHTGYHVPIESVEKRMIVVEQANRL